MLNRPALLLLALLFATPLVGSNPSAAQRHVSGRQASERHASDVRPAPAVVTGADSTRAIQKLAEELKALITLPSELKSGDVGVVVMAPKTGRVLFDLNGDKPLTPASTTKLVSAYSALTVFGPKYGIPTQILVPAAPKDGVLGGNLYVKGFGDPMFSVNDVDGLVDKIVATGIKKIQGDVVGDGTYFDNVYERLDYSGDADVVQELPPVSALSVEGNMFTVVVSSPRTAGQPCNVQTFPSSAAFVIKNSATSVGAAAKKKSKKKRRSAIDRYEEPVFETRIPIGRFGDELAYLDRSAGAASGAGITIKVDLDDQGHQVITVSGTLGVNQTTSRTYEMREPPMVVAGMFYERLKSRGVAITGSVRRDASPKKTRLIAEYRRPLKAVLDPVMKNSHNYYAEYLFKMVGGEAGAGKLGEVTAEYSRSRILQCMKKGEVPFETCVVNDGSGLSRRNLISARALSSTLVAAYRNDTIFKTLYDAMTIAGVDGTLKKRMKGTPAAGNVHGKTGTLKNVSALTGYVTTADGEMFAFAMLMNGYNIGSYKDVQNKVAARLARFTYREGITPEEATKVSAPHSRK